MVLVTWDVYKRQLFNSAGLSNASAFVTQTKGVSNNYYTFTPVYNGARYVITVRVEYLII